MICRGLVTRSPLMAAIDRMIQRIRVWGTQVSCSYLARRALINQPSWDTWPWLMTKRQKTASTRILRCPWCHQAIQLSTSLTTSPPKVTPSRISYRSSIRVVRRRMDLQTTLSPWDNNLIVRKSKFTLWLRIAAVMLKQVRRAQFLPGKARLRCRDWCNEVLSVGACSKPYNSICYTTKAIRNLSSCWSWKRSKHFWKNVWLLNLLTSMPLIILSRCIMRLLTSL